MAAKSWNPLALTGFTKTSNLILFLLVPCMFALFNVITLNRLQQGGWRTWNSPVPQIEKMYFAEGMRWWGMQIHLWSVVPAGILLPLQFLPVMRRKYMRAHKTGGRMLFYMLLIGNVTAFMMGPRAFGGTIDTQVMVLVIATSTSVSVYKAWSSIRRLEIHRHREWVIRTWAYAGCILTLRITMVFLFVVISKFAPYRFRYALSCQELAYLYRPESPFSDGLSGAAERWPTCVDLARGVGSPDVFVAVPGHFGGFMENRAAIANLIFGASAAVGWIVNSVLVEVYLNATKDEDERLKKYSAIRRKAAGMEKKDV